MAQSNLPPIESIQCFSAGAQTLNFRQAARTLGLSPSAFGQRIRQLEDHVGCRLFERTTRSIALTAAGSRLVPKAMEILASIGDLHTIAGNDSQAKPRTLTIATRHELGISWLTPLVDKLEKSIPGLNLHLYFGSGIEFWELLELGQVDTVISSARLPAHPFAFHQLHEETYSMVVGGQLATTKSLRSIASLRKLPLVDTHSHLPLAKYWLDAAADQGQAVFGGFRYLGTIAAVRDDVLRGRGVAVLPNYYIKDQLHSGQLKRIFPSKKLLSDHFRLVYHPKRIDGNLVESLAKVLRASKLQ